VVILGSGRGPRTAGFGLETTGVMLTDRGGIAVDERCQAGPGLWAVGDVTGVALFTHLAKYQGRVVADNILGRDHRASYEGIPRVVFADPEIAAVGLTAAQAAARSMATATAEISVADSADRSWTYERDPRGALGLLADRDRRVPVGAWAVAPLAGEWIHQAALAIRARLPHRHSPGPGRPVPHLQRGLSRRAGTAQPVVPAAARGFSAPRAAAPPAQEPVSRSAAIRVRSGANRKPPAVADLPPGPGPPTVDCSQMRRQRPARPAR
jgi:hypothetical protein